MKNARVGGQGEFAEVASANYISGGGLVAVRMTAKMEVKGVKIDPSLIKPDEHEILEDLLVTAMGDARRKAEAAMQDKMQALTGGLSLPGLGLT